MAMAPGDARDLETTREPRVVKDCAETGCGRLLDACDKDPSAAPGAWRLSSLHDLLLVGEPNKAGAVDEKSKHGPEKDNCC